MRINERPWEGPRPHSQEEKRKTNHNVIEMDEPQFIDAVKNDFGFAISNVEKVVAGYSNQVYSASIEGETVFIRINRDQDIFPVEVKGYEIFEALNVPVPKVLAYQPNPVTLGYPTIILSAARGVELARMTVSPEAEQAIYEDMGNILARINTTKIQGFGRLHTDEEMLKGEFGTWQEYQEKFGKRLEEDINFLEQNETLDTDEIESIREAYRKVSALTIEEAYLLHRDMHFAHVFVEDNKITGVIDLGGLEAGDPRYDIAMSLVFQTPTQQEAFKKGYGPLADDPIVDAYQLLIAARKIVFRIKNARSDVAEKTIDMFRKVREKILNRED